MTMPEMAVGVRPGDVLAGKYRVERVLGEGGMGVVVLAHHVQLDERVAIKFLLPEALKNEEAMARFDREARAAVKIKSEHVARVIDVGQLPTGAPYMVMEYLDGEDLDVWVQKRGPMPVAQAAEFVIQACEAIAEAHALGIVHRDLKPANLFCVRRADGLLSIKVLDFGISRMTSLEGSGRMTRTGAIFGSPVYMSPEQMESAKSADARSDIWSLGVILFELVSGRAPFDAESIPRLMVQVLTTSALPLRQACADAPEGFERAVGRCLARDPAQRFASVAELVVALGEFAPERSRPGIERILGTLQQAGVAAPLPSAGDLASSRTTGAPLVRSNPGMPYAPTQQQAPALGAAPEAITSGTMTGWAPPAGSQPKRATTVIVMALAVGLGVALGGVALLVSKKPAGAAAGAVSVPSAEAATSATSATGPTPVVTPTATPTTSASASASALPEPPSTAAPSATSNAALPRGPAGHRGPGPSATRSTAPKASCNPPFTFDSSGTKIFKKECL